MGGEERFNEKSLSGKKEFYCNLTVESITDLHYKSLTIHAKRAWKEFRLQNLGQDQDLYVQSDTLLLADIFESFRKRAWQFMD